MTRANADWLTQTTKQFNASQHDVHVTLTQFPTYQDLLTKYLAGLSTKDLPDLFQPEDTTVQRMIDSQSVVPVQACVDADHYSLAPLLPRVKAYFSYKNVLYGMPWSISNPILWYNATAFTKAGLDPNKPPQTLAQVKEYSQKIVASGAAKHGIALRVEPYIFEFLNAKSGGTLVNNGNGRDARTTAATIDTPTANTIWTWWNDMVQQRPGAQHRRRDREHRPHARGRQRERGDDDGGERRARHRQAGARVGPVQDRQDRDRATAVDQRWRRCSRGRRIAVDQQVGLARKARRGLAVHQVPRVGPNSRRRSRSKAATRRSVPTRRRCRRSRRRWRPEPIYRVSYDQLTTGEENAATAGSLIGDYQGVRDGVKDGMLSMLTGGLSPAAGAPEGPARGGRRDQGVQRPPRRRLTDRGDGGADAGRQASVRMT